MGDVGEVLRTLSRVTSTAAPIGGNPRANAPGVGASPEPGSLEMEWQRSVEDQVRRGRPQQQNLGPQRMPSAKDNNASGLVISFQLPDGSQRNIIFGARRPPLGMDFEQETPITISDITPGSHADQLGVGVGWQVIGVNGVNVQGKDFMTVFELMRKHATSVTKKK